MPCFETELKFRLYFDPASIDNFGALRFAVAGAAAASFSVSFSEAVAAAGLRTCFWVEVVEGCGVASNGMASEAGGDGAVEPTSFVSSPLGRTNAMVTGLGRSSNNAKTSSVVQPSRNGLGW
jgi:hypothetical protein